MSPIEVVSLASSPETRAALSVLLIETVAHGGSVSFMHPLSVADADAFWTDALAAADRGGRVILGAYDGPDLVGTVSLFLDLPPNQPHRAEIAKLMTAVRSRGRGIARALMLAAEERAVQARRSLLVFDTAAKEGAAPLYEKLGYTRAGQIPNFALKPHGGLTATIIYWKFIGAASGET